jgi:hypothetical protein
MPVRQVQRVIAEYQKTGRVIDEPDGDPAARKPESQGRGMPKPTPRPAAIQDVILPIPRAAPAGVPVEHARRQVLELKDEAEGGLRAIIVMLKEAERRGGQVADPFVFARQAVGMALGVIERLNDMIEKISQSSQ